jgi:hypothetical protein
MSLTLTASQVTDYLLTNSFCNTRTDASNKSSTTSSVSDVISTTTLTQTLKLLSGSSTNLDKVLANLKEMQTIADSVTSSSSESDRETAYAKLRSLASGMDDILEKTTFNKNEVFDGSQLDLTSAGQYNRTVLDDLTTTSKTVALATETAGAEATISYDSFCKWNNATVGLEGLDISSATGCKITAADTELEDGNYVVKVSYAGAKSKVYIQQTDGTIVSEADDVDLSGSGVATVNMDCGVQLTFDKTQVEGSTVDKYDYENNGPAVLYADLSYNRVNTYNLAGSETATDRSIETVFTQSAVTDSSGGKFSIGGVGLGTLTDGQTELDEGTYKVQVYKTGEKVSAIMYDSNGKVTGSVSDVILNDSGTTSLDFGNGVAMTVSNSNFSGSTSLVSTFNYTPSVNAYDDFDFSAYSDAITAATKTVTEQQSTIDDAYALANTVSKALNGTLSSSINSTTSQLITNLLGGSGSTSATSLLSGSSSSNTGLAWATSLITNNLSASLGLSTDSDTSLSSLLGGTVTSLDPTKLPTHVSVTA